MKEETFHRRRTFYHCVVLCRPWMAGEDPMNITEINRNTGVKKITIKDKDGSTKGSITIRSSGIKKTKKLQYISRRISTQIISAKTSGNAREVMTRAKGETVRLRRKLVSGDYDRNEVRRAIIHAERMERIAKKRMKHLQEEEYIKKHGGSWQSKLEQEQEEELTDWLSGAAGEEFSQLNKEEIQKIMRELQKELAELERESSLEENTMAVHVDMDPGELELLKKKHRSEEMREIMEADLKYLKAVFAKMERDRQEASEGVSLELSGAEIPVQIDERSAAEVVSDGSAAPVAAEGGSIDISV